ncbi:TapB family protein [Bradyrhizobium sp. USDA 4353]
MRRAALLMCSMLVVSGFAARAETAAPAAHQDAIETMEDAQTGDHWTYEIRDEIAGTLKSTMVQTITDVGASEIGVQVTWLGNSDTGFLTFDRNWNVKTSGAWRYQQGDGTGISPPLSVGRSWPIKSNDINPSNGINFRRTGTSKVVGQESVTTKAGTFESYKIETTLQGVNAKDPSRKMQLTQTMWYAPAVDHWIKRTSETRIDGHVQGKTTMELVEYGRR